MPKYDYICKECKSIQEVTHSIKEDPVVECLTCHSHNTRRMVGATRTVFKGGGWAGKEAAYDRMGVPSHVRKHADERL